MCSAHSEKGNELKIYCIECRQSACKDCVSSSGPHHDHELLRVWKRAHQDSVSVDDMKKYFDCSEIRPYKCNLKYVLILNPKKHSGSESCNVNPIKVGDQITTYRYCSIACKIKDLVPAVIPDENQNAPQERQENPSQEGQEIPPPERQEENAKPASLRKRSRKGTPHRAPFF